MFIGKVLDVGGEDLFTALDQAGRSDIMIVVGGVIPPEDVQTLIEMGASAVFPPGTVIPDAAMALLDKLNLERLLQTEITLRNWATTVRLTQWNTAA